MNRVRFMVPMRGNRPWSLSMNLRVAADVRRLTSSPLKVRASSRRLLRFMVPRRARLAWRLSMTRTIKHRVLTNSETHSLCPPNLSAHLVASLKLTGSWAEGAIEVRGGLSFRPLRSWRNFYETLRSHAERRHGSRSRQCRNLGSTHWVRQFRQDGLHGH